MKNIVRDLRVDQGWSQTELGERLEVSRQTIHASLIGGGGRLASNADPSTAARVPRIAILFKKSIEKVFFYK